MSQLMNEPALPAEPPAVPGAQWLELYGDRLYSYALARVRRSHIAEDLVQETLLAAMRSRHRFENRSMASTWLIGILKNKIADHFRQRSARQGTEEPIPEEQALFDRRGRWKSRTGNWTGDPQQIAQSQEFQNVLHSCLAKLPSNTTQVFVGRVVEGETTLDLCSKLKITPDHAWTLLHRARLGLRECLTRNWFTSTGSRRN